MTAMIFLGVLVASAVLAWFVQVAIAHGYRRYEQTFQQHASLRLREFFLFLDPARLWMANMAFACLAGLVACAATADFRLALMAAGAAVAMPPGFIGMLRRKRMARFEEQLPDFLAALAGSLRAGSGLHSALRYIVSQSPDPLSQEFGLVLREQRLGRSLDDALRGLHSRMPLESVALVVSCVAIASQTGGSLAETLERVSTTLRARLHLLGRVKALTSQGRMQAWIMASLPPGLMAVLNALDPSSMSALWTTPRGWAVLALIALLEVSGLLLIRRIVAIDV